MKIQFKSDLQENRSGKTVENDVQYALLCVIKRENWKSTKENPTVTKLLVCLMRRRVNFDVIIFACRIPLLAPIFLTLASESREMF
jgi:hypothetical protein